MLPAMVHRTLSARDVSYLKEGPLKSSPCSQARADLCLLVPRPVTGIRGRAKHDARTHQEICVLSTGYPTTASEQLAVAAAE